ncbi:uncharacterized protein LOC114307630 [Camellia sinensis]|uniref:uncharacterized protein LOC114307630 n=1 Tax=Camellia sinensis TaxID=4442 RepID=UPI001036ED49|nr:uncharacterized protein LOC114307630 [Camellia sinensis]
MDSHSVRQIRTSSKLCYRVIGEGIRGGIKVGEEESVGDAATAFATASGKDEVVLRGDRRRGWLDGGFIIGVGGCRVGGRSECVRWDPRSSVDRNSVFLAVGRRICALCHFSVSENLCSWEENLCVCFENLLKLYHTQSKNLCRFAERFDLEGLVLINRSVRFFQFALRLASLLCCKVRFTSYILYMCISIHLRFITF